MDHRIERHESNVNASALAPLRDAYRRDVKAIAQRLALRFQARKFDNTAAADEDVTPFLELERFCEDLPMCRNSTTARIVLAVSKYAGRAPSDPSNQGSFPQELWRNYSAWCLARD